MTRFDYKRRLDIGDQVAESDRLLKDHFVAIGAHEYVGTPKPCIIVGRKGAGETALRLHFEGNQQAHQKLITIEPSNNDLIGIFEYIVHKEGRAFSQEFIAKIWELTILFNLARTIFYERETSPQSDTPPELSTLPEKILNDIKTNQRYGIGRTLDVIAEYFPADDKRGAFGRSLKSCAQRHLRSNHSEYYILIDSVDDVLHRDIDTTQRNDLFATFFESLWSFFRAFANQNRNSLATHVFLHVFVPFDLYNWSIDRHADHLRQYKHAVSWESSQLEEFITSRLVYNLSGVRQKSLDKQDDRKRLDAIWSTFFPETIVYEAYTLRSVPALYTVAVKDAIITMTLRRPRDLQEIVRQIYERTKEARKSFPTPQIILDAFDQYSTELRQSVEQEYDFVFPEMREILTQFSGNDTVIEKNTLEDLIGRVVGYDSTAIFKAASRLFEACILGAVSQNAAGETLVFYYNFQNFIQLWNSANRFGFHRAFWHSLVLESSRGRRQRL